MTRTQSRVSRWINSLLKEAKVSNRDRKGRKGFEGRTTKLPSNRWLEAMFELNEYRAIQRVLNPEKKPLTDEQIKFNWCQEFERTRPVQLSNGEEILPGGAISSGKWGIGMLRNWYRQNKLYPSQNRPLFMSFKYSPEGHILKDGKYKYRFMTFEDCQSLCIQHRTADPRFFSVELLEKIHHEAARTNTLHLWSIPTKEEIQEISKEFPFQIYRCIKTSEVWKQDPVPSDYSPPQEIQEEIEEQRIQRVQEGVYDPKGPNNPYSKYKPT